MNKFTKFLYALLIVLAFTVGVAFSQVKVIHFNAGWNEANNVQWFNKLSDAGKKNLSIATREEVQEYIDELIISKF